MSRSVPRRTRLAVAVATSMLLAACSSTGPRSSGTPSARPDPGTAPGAARRGGYYLDDGPGANPPPDIESIPDATPRAEPLLPRANRPYVVFDRQYTPMTSLAPYRERGPGSWYGRKYHGQRTSSGEVYDMYAMTAAHPTLPIPSYARVTSVRTGRSVVVRVNDRGPFLYGRVIDLSYTAAAKLGYVGAGSGEVEVELITRFDPSDTVASRPSGVQAAPGSAAVSIAQVAGSATASTADGRLPSLSVDTVVTGVPVATTGGAMASGATQAAASPAPLSSQPERLVVETSIAGQGAGLASPAGASVPGTAAASMLVASAGSNPATATLPTAAAAVAPRGLYLQLAAFTSRDNAESSRSRIARELDWLADRLQVRQEGALYKVHAGPYQQRDEALSAADRIRQATAFKPFPVAR